MFLKKERLCTYKLEKFNENTRYYESENVKLDCRISYWQELKEKGEKENVIYRIISCPIKNNEDIRVSHVIVDFPNGDCWLYTSLNFKRFIN